ncbi:hypothetical protein IMSAG249_00557 [Lachnospiraceae bacterium]|nr:hypothetical protein IMSAG249_00557 [Lachnospiraceae bacterium]
MRRKIIIIIKELKIHIILLIISVILICKFSSAPLLFRWMTFFLRPQEETVAFEVFRIMENLSLAYIASLIFYLVVDYIPKKKSEEKAFELLKPHLVTLFMWMNRINSYFKCVTDITDFSSVSQEKIKKIDDFHFNSKSLFYKETSYRNGIKNGSDIAVFHGVKEIKDNGKLILEVYKDMDAISAIMVQASSSLISILSKIRNSKFLEKIIHIFNDDEVINETEFVYRYFNFYKDMAEFAFLEMQLAQYDFDKITVVYREASESEILEWISLQSKIRKEHPV